MGVRISHLLLCLVLGLSGLTAAAADAPDRENLRKEWHRCVRQAFSGQPESVAKPAAERAALAACKSAEDAYVAAELGARQAEEEARRRDGHGLTARARAALASVAAYVVDPVTAWIGGWGARTHSDEADAGSAR